MKNFSFVIAFIIAALANISIAQVGQNQSDSIPVIVPTQRNADLGILIPPPCFIPAETFNGYLCLANGAAILMQIIDNVSYLSATRGMSDEFFKTNGFTFISVIDLKSNHGVKGKAYKLSYSHKDQDYIRYMVFAGDLESTIWLNITYMKVVEELMELEVLKSLQTLTLNPKDNEK